MIPYLFVFHAASCECVTLQTLLLCCLAGPDQSKEVIFPQSPDPSFLTVPGEGFAEPFALTPGKWIIHIRAQGVLLVSVEGKHEDFHVNKLPE